MDFCISSESVILVKSLFLLFFSPSFSHWIHIFFSDPKNQWNRQSNGKGREIPAQEVSCHLQHILHISTSTHVWWLMPATTFPSQWSENLWSVSWFYDSVHIEEEEVWRGRRRGCHRAHDISSQTQKGKTGVGNRRWVSLESILCLLCIWICDADSVLALCLEEEQAETSAAAEETPKKKKKKKDKKAEEEMEEPKEEEVVAVTEVRWKLKF